nr:caspase recruitment domain-containing protein 8-like [Oncorhynchus nerka]
MIMVGFYECTLHQILKHLLFSSSASPTDVPSTVSAVSPAAPTANPSTPPGRAFIRRNRMSLETRLGLLQPIFLRLQDRRVLIDEEREEVVSKSTKTLQNQALLDMVVRKGSRAQEHFYQVLKEVDPCLVEDQSEREPWIQHYQDIYHHNTNTCSERDRGNHGYNLRRHQNSYQRPRAAL